METKRIFISVDLPPEIKDLIKTIANPEIRWIKWMKAENLHITLNFLGELNNEQIKQAKEAIAETVPYYQPFQLNLSQTRGLRDMLWLEPEEEARLFELRDELTENLKKLKIRKRERRDYQPHILLAKTKTGRRMARLRQGFGGVNWDNILPLEFAVNAVKLYESKLTPGAATHTLIESFPLG